MTEHESAHVGKTVRCYHGDTPTDLEADLEDTDADPIELTFEEHGRFLSSVHGTDDRGTSLRERFEAAALRFDCPECGRRYFMCPTCSDPDEHSSPGWFRGESTGDMIACHNCNAAEAARQRRGSI